MNSIELKQQRNLIASLISVVSNLCFNTQKFRNLLKAETPTSFYEKLKKILLSVKEKAEGNDKTKETSRLLVKQSLIAFLSNLTADQELRLHLAKNVSSLLDALTEVFTADVKSKAVDWEESCTRFAGLFSNLCLTNEGIVYFIQK